MPQERRGKHRFAKQIGGWGSFADVEVVVIPAAADNVIVDVVDLSSDPRRDDWVAGMQFGVRYALEHIPSSDSNVSVRVVYLNTNPVDSSILFVAFATCFAIWNAMEFPPENAPYFNDKSKSFVFPR